MRRVYMDANATTPLLPEVMEAMRPYWMEHFGNASSIHLHGQQARTAVDRARETLARVFQLPRRRGGVQLRRHGGRQHGHLRPAASRRSLHHHLDRALGDSARPRSAWPSTAWRRRSSPRSRAASSIPTTFCAPSGPQTRLISVMLANNETGVLQPVEQIGKIAADTGVFFHIDAVQGAGKVPIRRAQDSAATCSPSARTRCTGPRALAPCSCAAERRLSRCWWAEATSAAAAPAPRMCAGIVGWPRPRSWPCTASRTERSIASPALRDRLEAEILQLPGTGVNGADRRQHVPRAANTTNIWFDQLEGEALVIALDLKGVAVSRRVGVPLRRDRAEPRADGDGPRQEPAPAPACASAC